MIDSTYPDPTYPGPTPPPPAQQAAGVFGADRPPTAWGTPGNEPQPGLTVGGAIDKGTSIMLGWFDGEHLTDPVLALWSARFRELAEQISAELILSAERSAALRHLLEAKDAAVRAQILTNRAYNR